MYRVCKQHYMCMEIYARHWFLYVKIIWICQWVLLFFSAFFLPWTWLPPPLVHGVVMLATSLCCAEFFICFHRNQFCSPTKTQIFLSQSEGWFSFILLCRLEKYRWTGSLGLCYYKLYQQNFRTIPTYVFVGKLSQCDKCWSSLVHTHTRKINLIYWKYFPLKNWNRS